MFDIVTWREKMALKDSDLKEIKKDISELTERLNKEKLVMDWTKQQKRIADVKVTIERELDQVLPEQYDRQLFAQTCNEVLDHVYKSY